MKLFRACVRTIIISLCLIAVHSVNAQTENYTIQIKDSLQATDSTEWLSNDILIRNGPTPLRLQLQIILPDKWNLVNQPRDTLRLAPYQSIIVPVNILRMPQALAKWQPASIIFKDASNGQTITRMFYLKSEPYSKFSLASEYKEFFVYRNTKNLLIQTRISNTGNTDDDYRIELRNDFFDMNERTRVSIEPGKQSVFNRKIRISRLALKDLNKELVRLQVTNSHNKILLENFTITKLHYQTKKHPSAYSRFSIEPEIGGIYVSEKLTYYAAVKGRNKFKNGKQLNFSYRSKQLGIANAIERNVFELEYITKKWRLYAGQQADITAFFSFGQGFSVTHMGRKNTEINASAIFHYKNSPYRSDIISTYIKHQVKKSILKHNLAVNFVPSEKRFAFAFANDIFLFNKPNFNLSLIMNAGQEHYMLRAPGLPPEKAGTALGYNLGFNLGHLGVSTSFMNASDRYPGVLKGMQNQNHIINLRTKKIQIGVFYQYNKSRTENILFRDTVYNTDIYNFNMERWGASLGWNIGSYMSMILSGGRQRETEMEYSSNLGSFDFIELEGFYRKGRDFGFRFNSSNGYNPSYGILKEEVWVSRTNMAIEYKSAGLRGFYIRTPGQVMMRSTDTIRRIQQTMNIAPYYRFVIRKVFSVGLTYNFSKSLYDSSLATFLGVGINYANKRNGLNFRMNGNIPVSNTSKNFSSLANNNITFSLSKNLNIPIITKRKYYNLTVILFRDENKNLKMDPGELPLQNVIVGISGASFITSKKGTILYQNVEKQYYSVDLESVLAPRGYVAAGGQIQFVNVEKNSTYLVPYHKGKVISGRVSISVDSMALADERTFPVNNIKITATDSMMNYYKAITNAKGEYYLSLPPGTYKVSLNPEAFTGEMKPVQMFYFVTIGHGKDEEVVNFVITNKRKIRFFNK